ncbi:hypothetical protein FBU30_000216 [Linnemannia zychae]|nr:hypothetical protein FBU30_000216 [Linnemannia zychae]
MTELTVIEHDGIKYRLRISVGKNASTDPKDMHVLNANDTSNPLLINTDEFAGHVAIMIKGQNQIYGYEAGQKQDGHKPMPDSKWFENAVAAGRGENMNCIQIFGRFKKEWTGDQIVFVTEFQEPLKLPPFTSVAMKCLKTIRPGLQIDLCCPKPYVVTQLLNTAETVRITSIAETPLLNGQYVDDKIPQWPCHNGEILVEDITLAIPAEEIKKHPKVITDSSARRSHFMKSKNTAKHRYLPDHTFGIEIYNPFLDYAKFSVKLAGFHFDLFKYFNKQSNDKEN